jgi:mRNA interferase MazF
LRCRPVQAGRLDPKHHRIKEPTWASIASPLHLAAVATLATHVRKTRGILVDALTTVTRGHQPRTSPEDITRGHHPRGTVPPPPPHPANATAERLGRGVVTVVPVTSNVTRVYPFQVLLDAATTGLDRDSKAQAEQVRSVDVGRVGARVAVLDRHLVAELDEALRLHLAP